MAEIILPDESDFAKYELATEGERKVRRASEYLDGVIERFNPAATSRPHGLLPWTKTHAEVQLRPGEVSLWIGFNGHGKSQLHGQVVLGLAAQGYRCCVASFEMKPAATLHRMARQALRDPKPGNEQLRDFLAWTDSRLWLYDQQGTVKQQKILAVIRYCAFELKIEHFTVDSLMKCVSREDDFDGQKQFVDELTAIARDTGMHIHLIHHVRKGQDEDTPPNKMDARGSGSITDQVDNVFTIWRNKPKERARLESAAAKDGEPDALLLCSKQRNGEHEPRTTLWFDRASFQYLPAREALAADLTEFDYGGARRWTGRRLQTA
jgi:twinkle protein